MIIMMIIIIIVTVIIIIIIIIIIINNNNDINSGYFDSVGSRPTITAKYVRNNYKSSII